MKGLVTFLAVFLAASCSASTVYFSLRHNGPYFVKGPATSLISAIEGEVSTGALVKKFQKANPQFSSEGGKITIKIELKPFDEQSSTLHAELSIEHSSQAFIDSYSTAASEYVDLRLMGFSSPYSLKKIFDQPGDLYKPSDEAALISKEYDFVNPYELVPKSESKGDGVTYKIYHLVDAGRLWEFKITRFSNSTARNVSMVRQNVAVE